MKKQLISICIASLLATGCNQPAQSPAPNNTAQPTPVATPTSAPATTPSPKGTPAVVESTGEFLIVPGKSIGKITKESTEESLKAAYGEDNVKAESIYVGDGMEWPGLVVFGNDNEKRVEVIFEEDNPGKITMLKLVGGKSVWKTANGISLGTDLATLEKLNGKPFELMGLEWDFGGNISNWKGGKLHNINLRVGLDGKDPGLTDEEMMAIVGDQQVMSDHPAMKKANPTVFEITILFR